METLTELLKSIKPVAYLTYKGYLLHAEDPKVKDHSEPTPLYDLTFLTNQDILNAELTLLMGKLSK